MNKNSTLKVKDSKLIDKKELAPSLKTLDFLRKFARSCQITHSLSGEIKEAYFN